MTQLGTQTTYTATISTGDGGYFQMHDHNEDLLKVRCDQVIQRRGGDYSIEEIRPQETLLEWIS